MYRIKFFADFTSSEQCRINFSNVYGVKNNQIGNDILFVDDDSYTHVVLLNAAMPKLKKGMPSENVLGLAFEPIEILRPIFLSRSYRKYSKNNVGTYLLGKTDPKLPSQIFKQAYSYQWHTWESTVNQAEHFEKTNLMSLIVSHKKELEGHKYRHHLLEEILKTDWDIHIYGNGVDHLMNTGDPRIKGRFENDEPYKHYKFNIAIENTQSVCYISEKFVDPIAYNTVPIYYGADRVEAYFGHHCYYRLFGNIAFDLSTIRQIIEAPEKKVIDLQPARDEILSGTANFPVFLRSWLEGSVSYFR